MKLVVIATLVVLATFAWAQDDVQYDDALQSTSDFESVRVARSPHRQNQYYNNHRGHGNYGHGNNGHGNYGHGNHGNNRPYNQYGYNNGGYGRYPNKYIG